MGDRALGPVAVEHFQAESLPGETTLDGGEAGGRLADNRQRGRS